MVNQQEIAGKWSEVRGKLKEKWAKLTDDDLRSFNGNVDQLVGRIQQKTGESREAIEDFLGDISEQGSEFVGQLGEEIEERAGRMAEGARHGYDALREGYAEAGRVVQQRPGQSLAIAFGIGLVAGLGTALLLRGRHQHHPSMVERGRSITEQLGKQMLDAIAGTLPETLKRNRG